MKNIFLATVIVLFANIVTAEELTEFKSGDVATAAAFNNNFKIVKDTSDTNLAEISALKELLTSLQTTSDKNSTLLEAIQSTLTTLETKVTDNQDAISSLQIAVDANTATLLNVSSESNEFIYSMVDENGEKVLDVVTIGADGTLLVTDGSIIFQLNGEGVVFDGDDEDEGGRSFYSFTDASCTTPMWEVRGFNLASGFGQQVIQLSSDGVLYGLTDNSVKVEDGATYYVMRSYDSQGNYLGSEQCISRIYDSSSESGSHAYSLNQISTPEYITIDSSGENTTAKLNSLLSLKKQ